MATCILVPTLGLMPCAGRGVHTASSAGAHREHVAGWRVGRSVLTGMITGAGFDAGTSAPAGLRADVAVTTRADGMMVNAFGATAGAGGASEAAADLRSSAMACMARRTSPNLNSFSTLSARSASSASERLPPYLQEWRAAVHYAKLLLRASCFGATHLTCSASLDSMSC